MVFFHELFIQQTKLLTNQMIQIRENAYVITYHIVLNG